MSEVQVSAADAAEGSTRRAVGGPVRWVVMAVGFVLAMLPMIRMSILVRGGTKTQFADYWMMVPTIFRSDGWPSVSGLFELRNDHPIVIGKLLYWLNFKLTGGSNVSLGFIVIVVVFAQLIVLALMLRRHVDLPIWSRAALIVAFSAMLFSRIGSWNYLRSMSGAAWLTANLFVLVALHLEGSRRRWPALVFGVLASVSYGTGLMVWPALLVAGLCRDKRLRSHWRTALLGAVMIGGYLIVRSASDVSSDNDRKLGVLIHSSAMVVGGVVGGGRDAVNIGVAIVILLSGIAALVYLIRSRREEMAPWAGLFVWGLLCAVLIALGRDALVADFMSSRYYSIAALTMAGTLVLVALAVQRRQAFVAGVSIVAVTLGLVASIGGATQVRATENLRLAQDNLAIAFRVDSARDSTRWTIFEKMPHLEPLLRQIGHYPFNSSFTFGCGRIGTKLKSSEVVEKLPDGYSAKMISGVDTYGPSRQYFGGDVSQAPNCVVITNGQREVVGAGTWAPLIDPGLRAKYPRKRAIAGSAPVGEQSYRMYVRFPDSSRFYRVRSAYAGSKG